MIPRSFLVVGATIFFGVSAASADPIYDLVVKCKEQLNKLTVGPTCMMVRPTVTIPFSDVVEAMQRQVKTKVLTAEGVIETSGLRGFIDEHTLLEAGRQYAFFY